MQIKRKDYHILPSQARARFVTRCLRHNPSLRPLLPSPFLWPFDICIAGYRESHQIQRRLSKNYDKRTRHRTNTDSNFVNLIPRRRRERRFNFIKASHLVIDERSLQPRMFPGLYKSFDKYLLVHLLTQHDYTVRRKAYHADVTKKRVPGLQMSNPG